MLQNITGIIKQETQWDINIGKRVSDDITVYGN